TRFARDWSSDVCSSDLADGTAVTEDLRQTLRTGVVCCPPHRLLVEIDYDDPAAGIALSVCGADAGSGGAGPAQRGAGRQRRGKQRHSGSRPEARQPESLNFHAKTSIVTLGQMPR